MIEPPQPSWRCAIGRLAARSELGRLRRHVDLFDGGAWPFGHKKARNNFWGRARNITSTFDRCAGRSAHPLPKQNPVPYCRAFVVGGEACLAAREETLGLRGGLEVVALDISRR